MSRNKITPECKDALIDAITCELNTHDKRYMFLRMEFNNILRYIQIEGSPENTAWNIVDEFEKQDMLGQLIVVMNDKLKTKLLFEIY